MPVEVTRALTNMFSDIDQSLFGYFKALMALSVVTMALIQAGKDLLPIRRIFHRYQVLRWLQTRIGNSREQEETVKSAERTLLLVAADGNGRALYGLELEALIDRLKAVTQFVSDFPATHPFLTEILAKGVADADISRAMTVDNPEPVLQPISPSMMTARQDRIDARNRIRFAMDQAIAVFQADTASKWSFGLKTASYLISISVAAIVLAAQGNGGNIGGLIISAGLAGFLAPISRDLVAALQKLRA